MSTNQEIWARTEEFATRLLCPADEDLDRATAAADRASLPRIAISALEGKRISLLARTAGARTALEIGCLAGYSTLWLAKALPPDGRIVTIENDPAHAAVAEENFRASTVARKIELRKGDAVDVLSAMEADGEGPFDFFFIDADRSNSLVYLESCRRLGHPGSVVVMDNVVRSGELSDTDNPSPGVRAVQEVLKTVGAADWIEGAIFQTVGARGHDGILVARMS